MPHHAPSTRLPSSLALAALLAAALAAPPEARAENCENHYIHSFELENGRIKRNREFMNPMQKLRALGIAVPQIKRDGIPT